MTRIAAYAAEEPGGPLEQIEYDPGPLLPDQVEIRVHACGVCHSDLSVLKNAWKMSRYPLVPGHEAVGEIVAVGSAVRGVARGQRVGLGWFSSSCLTCPQCLAGDHNLCTGGLEQTILGRHGAFADRVRCHWLWARPLPAELDTATAGPLFCAGSTVFNAIVQHGVKPTDRVGVVGIGGLGHLALQLLRAWGCHVTAFTSSASKADDARALGAHEICDSRSDEAIGRLAGSLDFLLVTANVTLNWEAYAAALRPRGRLHVVGGVPEPVAVGTFSLLLAQRSIAASPLGSPATTAALLEFCVRHGIAPHVETYPMSKVNEALALLAAGRARYRIVLQNDF